MRGRKTCRMAVLLSLGCVRPGRFVIRGRYSVVDGVGGRDIDAFALPVRTDGPAGLGHVEHRGVADLVETLGLVDDGLDGHRVSLALLVREGLVGGELEEPPHDDLALVVAFGIGLKELVEITCACLYGTSVLEDRKVELGKACLDGLSAGREVPKPVLADEKRSHDGEPLAPAFVYDPVLGEAKRRCLGLEVLDGVRDADLGSGLLLVEKLEESDRTARSRRPSLRNLVKVEADQDGVLVVRVEETRLGDPAEVDLLVVELSELEGSAAAVLHILEAELAPDELGHSVGV